MKALIHSLIRVIQTIETDETTQKLFAINLPASCKHENSCSFVKLIHDEAITSGTYRHMIGRLLVEVFSSAQTDSTNR